MNFWDKFFPLIKQIEVLDNFCPKCKSINSLWRFKFDNVEYVDECVVCRYTKWWTDKDDDDNQTDYKNSLKNDY